MKARGIFFAGRATEKRSHLCPYIWVCCRLNHRTVSENQTKTDNRDWFIHEFIHPRTTETTLAGAVLRAWYQDNSFKNQQPERTKLSHLVNFLLTYTFIS